MLERLQRHPFAVEAFFRRSLVLTYAMPSGALQGLIGPGLELDTYEGFGFLAIALVQTQHLRPRGLPTWLGRSFFLSGYRIFTRFIRPGRALLRGLRILRSDTDRRAMKLLGNLFTRYGYHHARVEQGLSADGGTFTVRIRTRAREADLDVEADLARRPAPLPEGSPFRSIEEARQFAGPLPFTFGYDAAEKKMVVVKGVRTTWDPEPVHVRVREATFLDRPPFAEARPRLANAFYLENVPYWWMPGTLEELP
ncbi:MAG TPA: DUF2071 domain-containing protein [Myxococcaceae bacterium]